MAAHSMNDIVLLEKIANDDELAFGSLFDAWYDRLKSFGNKFLTSREIVEEVIQNVFVKIWLHRKELKKIQNIESYIYTVTRNEMINALKKELREKVNQKKWRFDNLSSPFTELRDSSDDPTLESMLEEAVQQLPEQQQKVYVLQKVHRLSQQQIASQLHLSAGTVKKHLQLATKSIKVYLQSRFTSWLFLLFSIAVGTANWLKF